MDKSLDETRSIELAGQIKSKARSPFDNAYRAALATKGAIYVQGFLVCAGKPYKPVEHGWIELGDCIIDPTLPHLHKAAEALCYIPAQSLTVKQLKAAVDEAKEDYPEDAPLPIYGTSPYEYYGDVMLGGKEYVAAYEIAEAKCKELNQRRAASH
jgi:hypothetical protein